MEPAAAETISCDSLEVFEDDVSSFAAREPEFVSVPGRRPNSASPSAEDARNGWLKVIERFTEPISGTKDCLRAAGAAGKRTISILCRRRTPGLTSPPTRLEGEELNPTDRSCLILFTTEDETVPRVTSTLIPWTDIVHMTFPLRQLDVAPAKIA